ncbi:MAG TPA: UDP-2,4-diacetamido-2,4,6-trideoxy-beta-L-altropyranose hydrolase [Terriglobia bacterium]|nr:UDP-2,4-diacetamido-2,4,6-trideoxy-beta-L-altropyranose hydrolase [Terriglobia bacterium]
MTRILFRADLGAGIGLGHWVRSVSLAAAARDMGAYCQLLAVGTSKSDVSTHRVVARSGFDSEFLEQVALGGREDFERTLTMALRHASDVVVVDSYHANAQYLEGLRAAGFVVGAIDDLAEGPFACHIVVNGGAQASELSYRSSSGDTTFLLGPRYALLRPEFWSLPHRVVTPTVKSILVTLGGGDLHNLMPKLIVSLRDLPEDVRIGAVLGPLITDRNEIELAASTCRGHVSLVEAPDSLRDVMLGADLAIAAGGQTSYELAAAGTPAVVIEVAENQAASVKALARAGVVRLAGRAGDPNLVERVRVAVQELCRDGSARQAMAFRGQTLVDGRGAPRVAEAVTANCPSFSRVAIA